MLQIRNPAVINTQNLGRYLPYHLNIDEANGFPGYLSLKVLKELNNPQGAKAGEITPFAMRPPYLSMTFSTFS